MQRQKANEIFHVGEDLAAKFLANKGYAIVARNFRASTGEIDIIAIQEDTLVFVEVKTRSKHSIRQAMMNVSFTKRKRITLTAQRYVIQHPECVKSRIRFDLVIVLYFCHTDSYKLEHLEDAFLPEL
ncbi:MAG: YraN family protein [Candidatus Cloacimonetes bacterium]|jgi:putative endonuclease|nr:YraN family protein [Candidatus Cloacimonadota bacterium]MDD3144326.1 YraN family protein [Candidatus Cloacimonadota bacterium]MDY0367169.1 YraN family protein [Candidatus Syntrophosphaera sp.]HOY84672.1 YraN family protein [Candidatus Syntrophosphaera sp.]HPH61873.1 YraN family protein [Candidatus Syntrophosphaera sp.]